MKKFRLFNLFKKGKSADKKATDKQTAEVNKRFYSPHFDTLGSYTGNGLDPTDTPEQDSDDL